MDYEKFVDFTTTEPGGLVYLYAITKYFTGYVLADDAKHYPELNDGRLWLLLDGLWVRKDNDICVKGITVCVKPWAPRWLARLVLKILYRVVKWQLEPIRSKD